MRASILQRIDDVMKSISTLAIVLAGLLLVGLAFAMAFDVVGRALFNNPLSGLTELVELSMVPLVFIAFGWSARKDSHIQVDILSYITKGKILSSLLTVGRIITIIVLGWLAYISYNAAFDSFASGEVHYNLRSLDYWPFRLTLAVGLTLFAFEVLLHEIKSYFPLAKEDESVAIPLNRGA